MFCKYGNNVKITKIECWVFESGIYTSYVCHQGGCVPLAVAILITAYAVIAIKEKQTSL